MKITVWGCRGSLPAPGEETIRYGGNTTCLEVRLDDGTLIIIDAGSGIRKLGEKLLAEETSTEIYLFLTHAHWDHLMGFPFFQPAYLDKYRIHVRGGPRAQRSLMRYLRQQMAPPFFPVSFEVMNAEFDFNVIRPERKRVGAAEVIPVQLNHPNGGYGFKIVEADQVFVFLPDNELDFIHLEGLTRESYVDFSRGATLLMHDAQYTDAEYESIKKGWGHTKLSSAVELSIQAEVERFGLFHHDPARTDSEMDELVGLCQKEAAQVGSKVECFGTREGTEIVL
jgi:phosphoribosyl 1,2-cyclic phosphodiesterase